MPTGVSPSGFLDKLEKLFKAFLALLQSIVNPVFEAWLHFAQTVSRLIITGAISTARPILQSATALLAPIVSDFVAAFEATGGPIAVQVRDAVAPVARGAFSVAEAGLTAGGASSPDNAVQRAADAFAQAFGFGISSAAVTAAFEAAFPEKLNVLNGTGPMLASMAGFEEITKHVLGPLYSAAFGRSLEYHYRSIFKAELPDEADAVTWHARRLLTDDQLRVIFGFSGLKPEYEAPYVASAYRAAQPRAIVNAYQDVPFPVDEVRSMLEFAGFRPQDVQLMLDAFQANSTRTVRAQYLSAVTAAAERGTLTDVEVDDALTDLGFSADATHWTKLTIATRKLEQLAEIYRKSVSEAYRFGQIADVDYVPALEAIGIAESDARAHYAVDSITKRGREAAAELRETVALERQSMRVQTRAAVAEFQAGHLDAAGLGERLAIAGQPAVLIPFIVELELARKNTKTRNVYGKIVAGGEGTLLRERVAAVKEQVIKKLMDVNNAFPELLQLGIPRESAIALATAWAAQIKSTFTPPA